MGASGHLLCRTFNLLIGIFATRQFGTRERPKNYETEISQVCKHLLSPGASNWAKSQTASAFRRMCHASRARKRVDFRMTVS
jgi:hypothetical protein